MSRKSKKKRMSGSDLVTESFTKKKYRGTEKKYYKPNGEGMTKYEMYKRDVNAKVKYIKSRYKIDINYKPVSEEQFYADYVSLWNNENRREELTGKRRDVIKVYIDKELFDKSSLQASHEYQAMQIAFPEVFDGKMNLNNVFKIKLGLMDEYRDKLEKVLEAENQRLKDEGVSEQMFTKYGLDEQGRQLYIDKKGNLLTAGEARAKQIASMYWGSK